MWLDYATLRQCQADFNIGAVRAAISRALWSISSGLVRIPPSDDDEGVGVEMRVVCPGRGCFGGGGSAAFLSRRSAVASVGVRKKLLLNTSVFIGVRKQIRKKLLLSTRIPEFGDSCANQ